MVDLILKSDLKLKSGFDMKEVNIWDSAQWSWPRGIYWKWPVGYWILYGFELLQLPMCSALTALSYKRWTYPSTIIPLHGLAWNGLSLTVILQS